MRVVLLISSLLLAGCGGSVVASDNLTIKNEAGAEATLPAGDNPVEEVALGARHSCARLKSGAVYCWGTNQSGAIGDGTLTDRLGPVLTQGLGSSQQLALTGSGSYGPSSQDQERTCALVSGGVWCWGSNAYGTTLGIGMEATTGFPKPQSVHNLTTVEEISLGNKMGAARLGDGTVQRWGVKWTTPAPDTAAQVLVPEPEPIPGLGEIEDVELGGGTACAIDSSRTAWCWGLNMDGEVGDGTRDAREDPVRVVGLGAVQEIQVGDASTCARWEDGVSCWGCLAHAPDSGTCVQREVYPKRIEGVPQFRQLAVGADFFCGLALDATVWCWGNAERGQRGDETTTSGAPPRQVKGLTNAKQIAAGAWHACAIVGEDSHLVCWGANDGGQLGEGTRMDRSAPTPVVW